MNIEACAPGRGGTRWSRLLAAAPLAATLLSAFAVPAAAQPAEPPGWWLAETPGTGGVRFGLGVDYLFEPCSRSTGGADGSSRSRSPSPSPRCCSAAASAGWSA